MGFIAFSIQMKTAGSSGARGGPVFLKRKDHPQLLIGVAIETKVLGKPSRPYQSEYLNFATALAISLTMDIFESEAIMEQCVHLGKFS